MDKVGKLTMTTNTCPTCGNEYKQIGNHWQFNESHIPTLSERQNEIIKGLVLGDGYIDGGDRNSALVVDSVNPKFLHWLESEKERFLEYIGDPIPGFEYKWE